MSDTSLKEKYYVHKAGEEFADVTALFDGLRILKAEGLLSQGKPVNIYNAQWINSQREDIYIPDSNGGEKRVYRENIDIEITFIVSQRYASEAIDVMEVHDAFIEYMTNGEVWLSSAYAGNKAAHCICQSEYKPTTTKLQRGGDSYVMGTLTLHTLDKPTNHEPYELYIGIAILPTSLESIQNMINVQHYEKLNISGNYSIVVPVKQRLWICTSSTLQKITSGGFEVPLNPMEVIGGLNCYYTDFLDIHTMYFTILT